MSQKWLDLQIIKKEHLPGDTVHLTLADPLGNALPTYSAGAHIQLKLHSGLRRNYSLIGDGSDLSYYEIVIKRLNNGRGGSKELIDGYAIDDHITAQMPENFFPLELAPSYIFIAGGIGITPMIAFIKHLKRIGNPSYRLIYCTRSKETTPFIDWLIEHVPNHQLVLHHDHGQADQAFDFWSELGEPTDAAIYCCGPTSLMEDVKGMTGHWEEGMVHFEDFGTELSRGSTPIENKPFTVIHQKTKTHYLVDSTQTIIESLRTFGIDLASSCESGTCGTCKTRYLAGEVDHRDLVLNGEDQTQYLMICVSRAKSDILVLDW